MEDLNTALIRFQTTSELYAVEGFDNKGVANATKGSIPLLNQTSANPIIPPVSLFGFS